MYTYKIYTYLFIHLYYFVLQTCPIKFGSWSFDASKMDVLNVSNVADLSYWVENGEWELLGMTVKRKEVLYTCCKYPYPDVTFWIKLRRKPLYYIFNLILPCVFITATTVLVFYLPVESGEKVSLGVTVLLALTVFLLLVAETMPPQSVTIPLIGEYRLFNSSRIASYHNDTAVCSQSTEHYKYYVLTISIKFSVLSTLIELAVSSWVKTKSSKLIFKSKLLFNKRNCLRI